MPATSWSLAGTANYNDAIPTTAITDIINKASSTTKVTIVGGPFFLLTSGAACEGLA